MTTPLMGEGMDGVQLSNSEMIETEDDTYSKEDYDDNNDENDPKACRPPPCLPLVFVSCCQFFCCARSVHSDRGHVVLNVIYPSEERLVKKAELGAACEPSISPCSCTIVPKSLNISCNSWIPVSISLISASRSWMRAS